MSPHVLNEPAEGSREIVERELRRQSTKEQRVEGQRANAGDVSRLLGEPEESVIAAVLALEPTLADVEAAILWARGEGDILGREGRALTGIAAEICEIMRADLESRIPGPNEH